MRTLIPLGLALLAVACAGTAKTGSTSQDSPIADQRIGLSKASVFDTPAPGPVIDETSDPGERSAVTPAYGGSPPVIPHAVSDFVPITLDGNFCIDCHMVERKAAGEPTPIPQSHFEDLRNAPGEIHDEIAGARYDCLACHVARTEATPLVENRFGD
jgi:cytochrome c-type protein NapB